MISISAQSPAPDIEAILNDEAASIETLSAHANARYAIKDYDAAAELYSKATELQAEVNGEMSTKNADLLYSYGRCLYHVAVRNSDVLGSKVAGEKRDAEQPKPKRQKTNNVDPAIAPMGGNAQDQSERVAEEAILQISQVKKKDNGVKNGAPSTDKPCFQFTGDENFDDSETEDELAGGDPEVEAEEEDPEDDFSNAYEVLDLARLLLQRRLAEAEIEAGEAQGKGKASASAASFSDSIKQLKERLADTHDLQAEISLEGERFPAAVEDLRAALTIKQELRLQHSSILAEAHYKLSLALEFSSVTQQQETGEDGAGVPSSEQQAGHVDDMMREEAAREMEAAIASCKTRIAKEEKALEAPVPQLLAGKGEAKKPGITRASIDDVIDMVKDMEQRLTELREPPVSMNDPTGTGTLDGTNPLSGILGSILGESPEAQKARVEEATKNANDVSGLVKRKKGEKNENGVTEPQSFGSSTKRKATYLENEDVNTGGGRKKIRE